ncbi:MAG: DnaD domain protein [Clostridiales bacterium]|nr:DnaD domain protein [Clostridiales bacterium]
MNSEEKKKFLFSDTQVPDIFITQYMPKLSGPAIQIYLTMLMQSQTGGLKISNDKLANWLHMSKEDLKEQLFYLVEAGLLEPSGKDAHVLKDIKAEEVEQYIRDSKEGESEIPPQHEDPKIEKLKKSIADTFFFGKGLSISWSNFIDDSYVTFKLNPDVIYALFRTLSDDLKKREKYDTREMTVRSAEKLRTNWCKRGVHTAEDLEKIMTEDAAVDECVSVMGKKTRKRLDGVAIDYVTTWITKYKMQPDVPPFLYTYLRKDLKREKVTFADMDEILQEWFSHNIHDAASAEKYEKQKLAADRTRAMKDFCGELFRKRLDGMDLEIIDKWVNEDHWEEPIVKYAYDVLRNYMVTITLKNVDDRLAFWKENGVLSVTRAKQFEAESKKKNQEAYQERKRGSRYAATSEVPYMEEEYTQEEMENEESDPMEFLSRLMKEGQGEES